MHHRISSMYSCEWDGASAETIAEKCKLVTVALQNAKCKMFASFCFSFLWAPTE